LAAAWPVIGSGHSGRARYRVNVFVSRKFGKACALNCSAGRDNAARIIRTMATRLFDCSMTRIKGGDFSIPPKRTFIGSLKSANNIIDQCVAQGVPFAREYGGLLANRSFGGAQVSRTFLCRGQTGQQLLLGCYQALCRQITAGTVQMSAPEMLDLVIVDGQAKGSITRNLCSGKIDRYAARRGRALHRRIWPTCFISRRMPRGCQRHGHFRAYKRGGFFANPCFTQIHPTCMPGSGEHQSKLTLMSESLRNDGRVWVPKRKKTATNRLVKSGRRS